MGLIKLEMDEQMSSIQNLRCDYSHNIIAILKNSQKMAIFKLL